MPRFARQLLVGTILAGIAIFVAADRRPDQHQPILYGVLGLFGLSTVILGVWHTRRFGGGLLGGTRLIAVLLILLGLIAVVPLASGHPAASSIEFTILLTVLHFAWTVTALSLQGHYPYTDREFSPLGGRSLTVAQEVLAKAGIKPLSIRVAPLGSFNAMVQGVGRYLVVVDRRAAESLTDDELRALIAHECGHVRTGGLLPYLAVFPVVVCTVELIGIASGMPGVWVAGLGLWRFAYLTLSQWLEFYCDRFAARLVSSAATVSMLDRVHDDLPAGVRRTIDRPSLAAVSSHPPLAARKRALDPNAPASVAYWAGWLAALGLVSTPFVLLGAALEPSVWRITAGVISTLYFAWTSIEQLRIQRALRRSHLAFFRHPKRGRWRPRALAWTGCLTFLGIVGGSVLDRSIGDPLVLGAIGSSCLFVLLLLAHRWAERSSGNISSLPRSARGEVIAASIALSEGHVDDALAGCERIPERHRSHPWVVSIEGSALAAAGRLDEAAARADAVLAEDPLFAPVAVLRLHVALARGESDRLDALVADLREHASHYFEVRLLCGLVAWDRSGPSAAEEARADFREARAIKPTNGGVGAAEALVLLGEDEVEAARTLLARAEAAERDHPLVHLARACERFGAGDSHAATATFTSAVGRLRALGHHHWEATYRRWAERFGLTPPPVDPSRNHSSGGDSTA